MLFDTLNTTEPSEIYNSTTTSDVEVLGNGITYYGTEQELPCSYSTTESMSTFDAWFHLFLGSQPDSLSPHDLPDLPQSSVTSLQASVNHLAHLDITTNGYPTGHSFASPIWPSDDENGGLNNFDFLDPIADFSHTSFWDRGDDAESVGQPDSKIRKIGGASEHVSGSRKTTSPQRKRRSKSDVESPKALQKSVYRCDFPQCKRDYKRREHLKRHIDT
jgi:hypothetical protein